jgi:hypothetical protein
MRDERLLPAITTATAASVIAVIAVATATTIAATAVSAVAAIATATAAAITTATAAITATAVAATAAVATLSAGLGLVDTNRAVAEHGAVERLNGVVRLRIVRHLDKTKALALASGAIHNDRGVHHFSERAKELRKLLIVCCVGQIAYVNPGGH